MSQIDYFHHSRDHVVGTSLRVQRRKASITALLRTAMRRRDRIADLYNDVCSSTKSQGVSLLNTDVFASQVSKFLDNMELPEWAPEYNLVSYL